MQDIAAQMGQPVFGQADFAGKVKHLIQPVGINPYGVVLGGGVGFPARGGRCRAAAWNIFSTAAKGANF